MKRKIFIILNGKVLIAITLLFLVLFTCAYLTLSVKKSGETEISSINKVYHPYYRGNTQKKSATIMFNVYWGNEYIESILDILKENDIITTFFIGGMWAQKYPDLLKKISDNDHEIGSHGYSHKDHSKLNYAENLNEIKKAEEVIENIIGKEIKLFAPPSGYIGNAMLKACEDSGYNVVMWSNDTIDWRDKNAKLIYERAIKNACGGELILMHPTQKTVEALQDVIDWYKNNGFQLTTVSENLS